MSTTADDHFQADPVATDGSESESESAAGGAAAYYHPISADSGSDSDNDDPACDHHHQNGISIPNDPNAWFSFPHLEANGVAGLDLNGHSGDDGGSSSEEDEETAREEQMRRALREEESRRSAPLPAENATRVMEAMRGVTFNGVSPDWVSSVPDDHWVNRLRSIRGERSSES